MIDLPVLTDRELKDEEIYADRMQIAEDWRRKKQAAIDACGPGATAYGLWRLRDREGSEPDQTVYCCRRPEHVGWKPSAEEAFPRTMERSTTRSFEHNGETVYYFRFECAFGHLDEYSPQTPSQLAAARDAREAKAEEKYRRDHPLFFQGDD